MKSEDYYYNPDPDMDRRGLAVAKALRERFVIMDLAAA
jgi:hypothetical protein